ncbi:MAG TPA: flagellar biosynthesis protein FliO [Xanthobacteraceae bacterium]|nr:flagellar biosynthesis protein FliO [Xanthobacteraceae bacterium]
MFDNLFGAEMPLAVRFFLAFLIVLGLIGVTAWAVRRFGTGRLGGGSTRGRQPRLAVIDYASVDGRRRLILVRRDNVEHLLMIGGPTDIVVEPNIVRAVAAPRELASRPPAGIEALPRAIPLPEGSNGSWPLQPEPAAPARPAPRVEPLADELPRSFPLAAEPPPRPQRDTLAALADELSARPTPSRNRPAPARAVAEEPVAESQDEPRLESRQEPKQEPRVELPRKSATPAASPVGPSAPPAPPVSPAPAAEPAAAPDQSLADMAQRLEAALRKPAAESRPQPAAARPAPAVEPAPAEPAARRMSRPAEGKPQRTDAKPSQGKTTLYDNLEQEMASLLGRPTKP